MNKPPPPSKSATGIEFIKINAATREWRDTYNWIVALTWPRFALFAICVFLVLNLIFASAYRFGGHCIGELPPDSFSEAFFFSVETLATVGYGHMYPISPFGHIVVTLELMTGMLWTAVTTGLIFVRFSRPTARVVFSNSIVIAPFEGKPTLMIRVANLRHHSMADALFRVMYHRDEPSLEGDVIRRFYPLKLTFDRLISFPAALTLRHVIDESSPLYGATMEDFQTSDSRFMTSVACVDTVIQSQVQSQQGYHWSDVRFGERFAEVYTESAEGHLIVDYGRLHETEKV